MTLVCFLCFHGKNTTVFVGNSSMVSDSMRDNPLMKYYAGIYTMSMVIMLLLKLFRGIIFVKVSLCEVSCRIHVVYTVCFE